MFPFSTYVTLAVQRVGVCAMFSEVLVWYMLFTVRLRYFPNLRRFIFMLINLECQERKKETKGLHTSSFLEDFHNLLCLRSTISSFFVSMYITPSTTLRSGVRPKLQKSIGQSEDTASVFTQCPKPLICQRRSL